MALATGTLWEMRATATTGNVNGAGFNTGNANFLTDLAGTSATGNSPVVTSASYTFVAGDVGAWVYVKSGTNWTPGFYQIASVATGAATLSAAVGAAVQLNTTTNMYAPSTVAGCATTASPTGGTFGVDYSQQDTAVTTATDFTSVGASTTLTSATAAFSVSMVGNIFHQTTTGTGAFGLTGWYEIVSYTNATTVTLDRTSNNGTTSVACTGFIGGAGRINALEDAFFEMIPGSSTVYFKSGTYTITGGIGVASTNSTSILTSFLRGYNSIRGDQPTAAQRPVIACGAVGFVSGVFQFFVDIVVTSTSASGFFSPSSGFCAIRCSFINTSSTAARAGMTFNSSFIPLISCEFVSLNGSGCILTVNNAKFYGCYFHDSVTGLTTNAAIISQLQNCVFASNRTTGLACTGASSTESIWNNTFYGTEAKVGTGLGLSGANASPNFLINNIFYGLATGISIGTGTAGSNMSINNDFFNNTADVTNWFKGQNDLALNPQFLGASQVTGTTATTSGSVLTDSGANFSSVVDGNTYLTVTAATGTTLGGYLITGHTTTTLTVNNALGTGSSVNYFVTTGTNFGIGNNLAGAGTPGSFIDSSSIGYPDIGAVQKQPTTGTGGGSFAFIGV